MDSVQMIKTVSFKELCFWDTKRYKSVGISSNFKIVRLGDVIKSQTKKYKLFNHPEKEFGILGVNNKTGIFDAYLEKGEKINQAYKKMEKGWLAYNPYRINVGSIGLRKEEHKHEYISPAYVVFSCTDKILPEYLFTLFKTDTFNRIINDNTTGSVRQNLKYETLAEITIPLPSVDEQNRIVSNYNSKNNSAFQNECDSDLINIKIENYIYDALGIEKKATIKDSRFRTISFKEVDRWSVDTLGKLSKIEGKLKGNYELVRLREFIESYQYGLSEKSSKEKIGPPMLRMNNIDNSDLVITDLKYIKIGNEEFEKYKLNKGDLLFNRTNSKELVGKTALFELDEPFTFASYLIRVVLDNNKVENNYINYLFNSTILQYQKDLVSRQITGQANINAQEMQDFLFPLPPLEKQIEIAKNIAQMKSQIKDLQHNAEQNRKQAITEFEQEIFEG